MYSKAQVPHFILNLSINECLIKSNLVKKKTTLGVIKIQFHSTLGGGGIHKISTQQAHTTKNETIMPSSATHIADR